MVYPYDRLLFRNQKGNKLLLYATIWQNILLPQIILLSERNFAQKEYTPYDSIYIKPRKDRSNL